jgi:uncharacterized membrane protein (DUF485 family)
MNPETVSGRMVPQSLPGSQEVRSELVTLIGAVITLVMLSVGVGIVFLQSFQEWGTFPSIAGTGLILYDGLAVAFVIVAAYVLWAWREWRLACE